MTADEKELVVEVLELAHGYSILGSIVPFTQACVELNARGSKHALLAGFAIKKCQLILIGDRKPTAPELQRIILAALDYITAGDLPQPS